MRRIHFECRRTYRRSARRQPRATRRSCGRPDLLPSTRPSHASLCLTAIAEPEEAEFHVARRDLRLSEQVFGRLKEHPVEDLFLLSRGLLERGAETRWRTLQPQLVR